jgi:hypothetical protein
MGCAHRGRKTFTTPPHTGGTFNKWRMFAIAFCINPEPPQIKKVKIIPLALRNFTNPFTPPFFAPHLPAV